MNALRGLLLVVLGVGIGLLAYHFLLQKKEVPGSKCPPFTFQSKTSKEDTAYKNYYKSKNPGLEKIGFYSKPVDTATLNGYVSNYKRLYKNGTFSFVLGAGDVNRLLALGGDIRVYFGLMTPGVASSGTVILTGANADGGDIYLTDGMNQFGIDQASPCPTDCPYKLSDAVAVSSSVPTTGPIPPNPALNPNKSMLGRLWDIDPRY